MTGFPRYEPRVYFSYHLDPPPTEPLDQVMFWRLIHGLRSKNIYIYRGIEEHPPRLDYVLMGIVFIDKLSLKNYYCNRDLQRFLDENKRVGMKLIAVIYETSRDSPLVTDIIAANPDCPDLGGSNDEENKRLGQLVSSFINEASQTIRIPPTSHESFVIETMDNLVDRIANDLNPFRIDFTIESSDDEEDAKTWIRPKFYYDVFYTMSDTLYNEVVNRPDRLGPSLIAIFEACGGNNCCCEIDTISKLVYTQIKNWSRGLDFNYYLYLSNTDSQRLPLLDVFQFEMHQKYGSSYNAANQIGKTFFVVIDDLQTFMIKEEDHDATQVLSTFVNMLGSGSLIVTTSSAPISTRISEDLRILMRSLGCVRATKCVSSLQKTTKQQWPACFTILNSDLNEFVAKQQHKEIFHPDMDTDDRKQKSLHAIDFELSGSAQKKLRESSTSF